MPTLKITHLRFRATADSDIRWPKQMGGNALRNGMAQVLLDSHCPERKRNPTPTAEHAATCPACYLLAANLNPGRVPRGYTMVPFFGFDNTSAPFSHATHIPKGSSFNFGLTLFGDTVRYMPHFALALSQLGRSGVGSGRHEDGGRFTITDIVAINPFTKKAEHLFDAEHHFVHYPTLHIERADVGPHIAPLLTQLEADNNLLSMTFHTMTRFEIKAGNKPIAVQNPDFSILFARTLFRLDNLDQNFASADRRPKESVDQLTELAAGVKLIESKTKWIDRWSKGSRDRKNKKGAPIGGFVGRATFYAEDWSELVPHLLWAQVVQAGKSTVRGNGLFSLDQSDTFSQLA